MVLVSYSGKEINAKLVYYGPGLSGKTTNLEYIYGSIPGDHRGKMVSMKTKTERTLFFDFLPVQLGELSGFKTRFLLYTVPGQVYYNATRKLVLKGVDAVVFVADSKRGKMDENIESLQNLRDNLKEHGLQLDNVPWVIQYNKRDLPEVYTLAELEQVLNPHRVPAFEAVATNGSGVIDTFKAVSRLLLKKLAKEVGAPAGGSGLLGRAHDATATGVDPTLPATAKSTGGAVAGPALGLVRGASASNEGSANEPSSNSGTRMTPAFDPHAPARPSGASAPVNSDTPALRSHGSIESIDPPASSAPEAAPRPQPGFTNSSGKSIWKKGSEAPAPFPKTGASSRPEGAPGLGFVTARESLRPTGAGDPVSSSPLEAQDEDDARSMGQRLRRWLKRADEPVSESASDAGTPPEESRDALAPQDSGMAAPAQAPSPSGATPPELTDGSRDSEGAFHAAPSRFALEPSETATAAEDRLPQTDVAPLRAEPTGSAVGPAGLYRAPEGGPREVVVPLELSPEDLESGIILRLDLRVGNRASSREAA